LFLLMAGMTSAFQMESLERKEPGARRRWWISLKRAGYILGIAFTFRFTNWVFSVPHASVMEMTKVDILNCMGVGMAVLAVAAVFPSAARARFALAGGLLIAAVSPLIAKLPSSGWPQLLQEYVVPAGVRGRFAFFPWVAYIAFGLGLGTIVKRTAADRFERLMQWSMLLGFALIFTGQYFSNLPISIYNGANFWTDSPALIVIRTGICMMIMAGAYLWTEYCGTEYCVGTGWSWMQAMGKNSLMVYWVHVMIVYGSLIRPWKRQLNIWQAGLATVVVTLMMVALSALWLEWKRRKAARALITSAPAAA
ncbi:MAG: heparan-alpha-glucosaminide N-acetyltransferase domain-containing protein, partial [Candidatus Solibacter sp.]